jgi:hypothetical protein
MSAFMKAWRRAASASAALAALASCGGDDGASAIEASAFCAEYVEVICGGLETCCSGSFSLDQCRFERFEHCEQNILTLDDRGIAPSGPNTPARIVFDFDEEGAGEALSRLRSQLAACDSSALAVSMFDATHYLGEPGSECLRHEDCMEGTRCEHPQLAVFGTCVPAPLAGELCDDVCAYREHACVVDPSDGRGLPVCVAPRSAGQTCDVVGCKQGLVCSSSAGSFEPICQPGSSDQSDLCSLSF